MGLSLRQTPTAQYHKSFFPRMTSFTAYRRETRQEVLSWIETVFLGNEKKNKNTHAKTTNMITLCKSVHFLSFPHSGPNLGQTHTINQSEEATLSSICGIVTTLLD